MYFAGYYLILKEKVYMDLKIEDLSISYGTNRVLNNINIDVKNGEIVSIIGKSGVGKTTLFNAVTGLIDLEKGSIKLNSKPIDSKENAVGYMLQKDLLLPYKTVIDNITLPLILSGIKKSDAIYEASKYLDDFGLSGFENEYPNKLSGGMKQRAALLRTYMMKRKFLLLDEPFSALDYITRLEIRKWYIQMAKKLGLTTLFITHDVDEALLISDRIYVLSGKPANIVYEYKNKDIGDFVSLTQEQMDIKRKLVSFLTK